MPPTPFRDQRSSFHEVYKETLVTLLHPDAAPTRKDDFSWMLLEISRNGGLEKYVRK